MLQNDYLVAKFGVDTAENEPLQIWAPIQFIIQFPPWDSFAKHMFKNRPSRNAMLFLWLVIAPKFFWNLLFKSEEIGRRSFGALISAKFVQIFDWISPNLNCNIFSFAFADDEKAKKPIDMLTWRINQIFMVWLIHIWKNNSGKAFFCHVIPFLAK